MNSKDIQDILMEFFYAKPVKITNYSGLGHEADLLMITKSGIVYEYEIKTSRSDFKREFSKVGKHQALKNKNIKTSKWRDYPIVANHYYFACKPNLIKAEDVPEYAGLVWVSENRTVQVIKKAPKLHDYKATCKMVWNIASTLSSRIMNGCSFLRYKNY